MNAVANVGPIAISAAAEPWQLYDKGVYNGQCGGDVDHAIQLVGYGTGTGKENWDYWLVRKYPSQPSVGIQYTQPLE